MKRPRENLKVSPAGNTQCPFCEGIKLSSIVTGKKRRDGDYQPRGALGMFAAWIMCDWCNATGPVAHDADPEEAKTLAARAWNKTTAAQAAGADASQIDHVVKKTRPGKSLEIEATTG